MVNSTSPFQQPNLARFNIDFPDDDFLVAALEYTKQHTSAPTVNHCLRSAAFALLAASKVPPFASADKKLVVLACLMHDLGWQGRGVTNTLISKEKRFEVDGADLGRTWMRDNIVAGSGVSWGQREEQLLWDAIALHTTPSIGKYKEAEVAVVGLGIAADFLGHKMPGGLFTFEQQKAIVDAFPRLGFADELKHVMCGLCRDKPETTYDNFVSEFGRTYGIDGKGGGKEEYQKALESHSFLNGLFQTLKFNEEEEAKSA
ncbi:hypothetical protein M409DRAFT_21585 [Zasmidium cellare ATCC 36951]|uniref:HD domain-containing protein n=1 Tax=Zasmidium cellare ATCC 36951 TaxID=1080233 RepID=A0A6A6CPT1_ZASCE|nr:uncharacterized protein M409DRAFT_21585 [Zasmidium cellare ATCC 36951]KAF2168140.1 hypothetical protein M409DRAFT_21585 [Zasmidium cellare ATCC 36951]